jgi:hypothetical protein
MEVWSMSQPGGSMKELTSLTSPVPAMGASNQIYDLNETSQFPWSNVSRDGKQYALQQTDASTHTQAIFLASLKGGKPDTVGYTDPGNSSLSLAGWTTM